MLIMTKGLLITIREKLSYYVFSKLTRPIAYLARQTNHLNHISYNTLQLVVKAANIVSENRKNDYKNNSKAYDVKILYCNL